MNNIGKKNLPIGTVITLIGVNTKIMITGFFSTSNIPEQNEFGYLGCEFPKGALLNEQPLFFKHNQIEKIYHLGYVDNEEKTNFKFDENGMIVSIEENNVPASEEFEFDVEGNVISAPTQVEVKSNDTIVSNLEEKVEETNFKFDENGMLISIEESNVPASEEFEFDVEGNVISAPTQVEVKSNDTIVSNLEEKVEETNFKFDENGMLISIEENNVPASEEFEFDVEGNVISAPTQVEVKSNDTIVSNLEEKVEETNFKFDENGMLISIEESNVPASEEFEFDVEGNVISAPTQVEVKSNDAIVSNLEEKVEETNFKFDENGMLVSIEENNVPASEEFEFDVEGNVISAPTQVEVKSNDAIVSNLEEKVEETNFKFDENGMLISIEESNVPASEEFEFDVEGNVISAPTQVEVKSNDAIVSKLEETNIEYDNTTN